MIASLDTTDLLIVDGDLVLVDGEPVTISGLAAVAQDIKHKIIESQLLINMIAERDPEKRAMAYKKVKILVENDTRTQPGSCNVTEIDSGVFNITANARTGETLELTP